MRESRRKVLSLKLEKVDDESLKEEKEVEKIMKQNFVDTCLGSKIRNVALNFIIFLLINKVFCKNYLGPKFLILFNHSLFKHFSITELRYSIDFLA